MQFGQHSKCKNKTHTKKKTNNNKYRVVAWLLVHTISVFAVEVINSFAPNVMLQ